MCMKLFSLRYSASKVSHSHVTYEIMNEPIFSERECDGEL